jgi:hypothetical protein
MNLKLKRYYPILILLAGILVFLAIGVGSYPIVAYGIN